jgi:hypothetical protein
MSVMFMLLQKLTFDGKFQICQILLLPTDSFLIRPYLMNLNGKYTKQPVEINTIFGKVLEDIISKDHLCHYFATH